jgi:uncharacterized protein
MNRITKFVVALLVLLPLLSARAEQVAKLPTPTGYVNDFAGVLSPETVARVDNLCLQVDRQAHAQIAVVTVKTIESDDGSPESIEEFATALEEKWKVGAKGTDRGVLMLFVMSPTKGRIEVGYGLEGILNDAKVGDIGRSMVPAVQAGNYDLAVPRGVAGVAQVIAADAGVTLEVPQMRHYREANRPVQLSLWQVLIGGGAVLVLLILLVSTGNAGWIFFILANLLGGGGGGGGGRDDNDRGGGFGGFGGGSSGGGGASGNW